MDGLAVGVHFPKAGGTALLNALKRRFGEALVPDYGEGPLNPFGLRQLDPEGYFSRRIDPPAGASCVFGHFHPAKYAHLDAVRFTVLRQPVDNLISIYFFWQTIQVSNGLHAHFLATKPTIEEFARWRSVRRLMSETFFHGVDMASFDLICRFEDHARTSERLTALLGIERLQPENATPSSPERDAVESDLELRSRLTDLLADDVAFYERWAL